MESVDVEWKARISVELHVIQERRHPDHEHTDINYQLYSRQPREMVSLFVPD